jgi:hypothetical protein
MHLPSRKIQAAVSNVKVSAKSVIAETDTGEWINFAELVDYQQQAFDNLKEIIAQQSNEDWQRSVTTKEFGKKS